MQRPLMPPGVYAAKDAHLAREKAWWMPYEEHAKPWIITTIRRGEITAPIEAWHGASTLLGVGYQDADGDWLRLSGYTLSFETLGHGGVMPGWSCAAIVIGMRSFMSYLTEQGAVGAKEGAHVLREIDRWTDRIVDFLDNGGPWCLPDEPSIMLS